MGCKVKRVLGSLYEVYFYLEIGDKYRIVVRNIDFRGKRVRY